MKKTLLQIILFLAFFGCKTSEPPTSCAPILSTGQILPLAVGNKWLYRYDVFDEKGRLKGPGQLDTFIVTQDTIVDGEKWFMLNDVFSTNKKDGLWDIGFIKKDSIVLDREYKYPGQKGDTVIQSPDSSFTRVIVSIDTVISTPFGCFHAYEYLEFDLNVEVHRFLAPGIGLLRSEGWLKSGDLLYKGNQLELMSEELH